MTIGLDDGQSATAFPQLSNLFGTPVALLAQLPVRTFPPGSNQDSQGRRRSTCSASSGSCSGPMMKRPDWKPA
jgi:hypothetical protein